MGQSLGRLGGQEAVGYGRRALVETTMGRYKVAIAQVCVRAIGGASAPKRQSRWHKPLWGRGNRIRGGGRATMSLQLQMPWVGGDAT